MAEDATVHLWNLRRMRARLATLGLDWDQPQLAPEGSTPRFQQNLVDLDLGEIKAAP